MDAIWISDWPIFKQAITECGDISNFYIKLNPISNILLQYFLSNIRPISLSQGTIIIYVHNLNINFREFLSHSLHKFQWFYVQTQYDHILSVISIQVFEQPSMLFFIVMRSEYINR